MIILLRPSAHPRLRLRGGLHGCPARSARARRAGRVVAYEVVEQLGDVHLPAGPQEAGGTHELRNLAFDDLLHLRRNVQRVDFQGAFKQLLLHNHRVHLAVLDADVLEGIEPMLWPAIHDESQLKPDVVTAPVVRRVHPRAAEWPALLDVEEQAYPVEYSMYSQVVRDVLHVVGPIPRW